MCFAERGRVELMRRVARNFQLKLHMRQSDRPRVIFEGFKRDVSGLLSIEIGG